MRVVCVLLCIACVVRLVCLVCVVRGVLSVSCCVL